MESKEKGELKAGSWTKLGCDYEWCVRCPGGKTGDKCKVRSKSGKTKIVNLGRLAVHIAPDGVFHVGTPDSIDFIDGESHERRLIVDGTEFYADELCRTIWEGDTKSLRYKISLGLGVLHDIYTIQLWCHSTGRWVQHRLISDGRYPLGMRWNNAASLLIQFWNTL